MALFTAIGAAVGLATVGGIAGAALGAGIGLTAAGAYRQAQSQKQQAAYAKGVALTNEQIALDNARDVELRGRQAVFDQRRAVARQLADVRSSVAGSGLVVDEAGTTPQEMVQSMAEAGELDILRLRNNIEREKRRALVQATSYEAQAGQFELQRASISPFRSAVTAGFGAATSGRTGDILFGG